MQVLLLFRGVSEWWKGGSILMKEHSQWVELAGHDYVMDLISDLELPTDFPKQKSYFIISTDDPARVRAKTSLSVHTTHCGSLTLTLRLFEIIQLVIKLSFAPPQNSVRQWLRLRRGASCLLPSRRQQQLQQTGLQSAGL